MWEVVSFYQVIDNKAHSALCLVLLNEIRDRDSKIKPLNFEMKYRMVRKNSDFNGAVVVRVNFIDSITLSRKP